MVRSIGAERGRRGKRQSTIRGYKMRKTLRVLALLELGCGWAAAQTGVRLPAGTLLRVSLEQRLPVDRRAGRVVRARVVDPVYEGDQLVIPRGAEVVGRVAEVKPVRGRERAGAWARADFTPLRTAGLEFSELDLGNQRVAMATKVAPHDGQMVRFGVGLGNQPGFFRSFLNQAKGSVRSVAHWFKSPGKMRSIKDYVEPRLPLHPQWIEAGTRYDAELTAPVMVVPAGARIEEAADGGSVPPDGAVVRARLLTPLDSATAKYGDKVEAELSEPLLNAGGQVLLPEGTKLDGVVSQARPARKLARGGVLRFNIRDVRRVDGEREAMEGTLLGAESPAANEVKIDAEGGSTAEADRHRTLATVLALRSFFDPDGDSFVVSSMPEQKPGGIGFLGMLAAVCSGAGSPVPMGFGAYNFMHSLVTHWLARGHEVDYPRNTAIELRLGLR